MSISGTNQTKEQRQEMKSCVQNYHNSAGSMKLFTFDSFIWMQSIVQSSSLEKHKS
jgi:hypothetical protein